MTSIVSEQILAEQMPRKYYTAHRYYKIVMDGSPMYTKILFGFNFHAPSCT